MSRRPLPLAASLGGSTMSTTLRTFASVVMAVLGATGATGAWAQGQGGGAPAALPEGAGREIAQARCLSCHDATRLVSPGYDRAGWQNEVARMQKIGVVVTP